MKNKSDRGQCSSSIGFIIASAGSAVGLGNLWKFPYVAGNNGGGIFVVIYLSLILFLGFTITLAEMAIGRNTKLSAVGAFEKVGKKWKYAGFLGVLSAFLVLSYYCVLGGWVLEYIVAYLKSGSAGNLLGTTPEQTRLFFDSFISTTAAPLFLQLIFMLFTVVIVMGGVSGGIEKASKIFMPALFLLFFAVMLRSLTLPGAKDGLLFFLTPDFSKITPKRCV